MKIERYLADTQLNARLVVARYLGPTGHRNGGDFGEREVGIVINCAFSPPDETKLGWLMDVRVCKLDKRGNHLCTA